MTSLRTLFVGKRSVGLQRPSTTWQIEGDHLVGYQMGLPPPGSPETLAVSGVDLVNAHIDPMVIANSFHLAQVPHQIVLPDASALVTDYQPKPPAGTQPLPKGGGSHGACEAGGVEAALDADVPLWSPSPPSMTRRPSQLTDVPDYFLSL